jgi:hypothetical protein
LNLPASWLESHPLTRNDLEQENSYLGAIEMGLTIESNAV